MATTLKGLKIRRVALVDKGANQEAHVTLFKRDDTPEEETVAEVEKREPEMVSKADLEAAIQKAEALEAEKAEITKQAEAAKAEAETVKAELAKRQEAEEIAKYDADAKATPFLGEQGGAWLRVIAKALGDEAYGAFHGKLTGVNAQVEGGALFTERGSNGDGDASSPDAVAEGVAKVIRTNDPTLTKEQALLKAYQTPEVRAAYNVARTGKGGK